MRQKWGTSLLATALIIFAPLRMMPPRSALEPTMKPVMLWRNTSGVSVRLQSWMNWAPFFASSENKMPLLPEDADREAVDSSPSRTRACRRRAA